jgi:hypothetical protein
LAATRSGVPAPAPEPGVLLAALERSLPLARLERTVLPGLVDSDPLPAETATPVVGADVSAKPTVRAGDAPPHATAAPARPVAPPPPYRGAPPAAQPPVLASLGADAEPHVIGERLLTETDAALARHTLLQAASLPDDAVLSQRDGAVARWAFETPFATPQGTAIAQFEIARDGRGATTAEARSAWRARFTLDVEPMGPVHVHIALSGARAAVTLWAEREASAAQLRADAPLLTDALREAELEPGDVLVRNGQPPRPAGIAAGPGRFLDRAS